MKRKIAEECHSDISTTQVEIGPEELQNTNFSHENTAKSRVTLEKDIPFTEYDFSNMIELIELIKSTETDNINEIQSIEDMKKGTLELLGLEQLIKSKDLDIHQHTMEKELNLSYAIEKLDFSKIDKELFILIKAKSVIERPSINYFTNGNNLLRYHSREHLECFSKKVL